MIDDPMRQSNFLGVRLQRLRRSKGFSARELAERLGVSFQAVYRWESGERIPDALALIRILVVLNADIRDLLSAEEQK